MTKKLIAIITTFVFFLGAIVQPSYARNHHRRHASQSQSHSSGNLSSAEKRFAKLIYNDLSHVPEGVASGVVLVPAEQLHTAFHSALGQAENKLWESVL